MSFKDKYMKYKKKYLQLTGGMPPPIIIPQREEHVREEGTPSPLTNPSYSPTRQLTPPQTEEKTPLYGEPSPSRPVDDTTLPQHPPRLPADRTTIDRGRQQVVPSPIVQSSLESSSSPSTDPSLPPPPPLRRGSSRVPLNNTERMLKGIQEECCPPGTKCCTIYGGKF
jgi:hypothetical protein